MNILVADVGNSNIVIGVFFDTDLQFTSRIPTQLALGTVGPLKKSITTALSAEKILPDAIDGAIISSVVPAANNPLQTAVRDLFKKDCLLLDHNMRTNIRSFDYDIQCLGMDRIADTVAAIEKYGTPVQVFDLGTCTTMSIIDGDGCFRGGTISAGVQLCLDTMGTSAAQLPPLHAEECTDVIGKNVIECMQNGSVIGTAAMIDGLILRSRRETHLPEMTAVITGGLSPLVAPHCMQEVHLEKNLLLDGLRILYTLNS